LLREAVGLATRLDAATATGVPRRVKVERQRQKPKRTRRMAGEYVNRRPWRGGVVATMRRSEERRSVGQNLALCWSA